MSGYQIVNLNESVVSAGAPNTLQGTGAIVSVGGTTASAGTRVLLTQMSDLAAVIGAGAPAIELTQAVTTFYAQGPGSVYVLELGPLAGSGPAITALNTYIATNPLQHYIYLVTREMSNDPNFVGVAKNYSSNTSRVYFLATMAVAGYAAAAGVKSILPFVEAPAVAQAATSVVGEFSAASFLYDILTLNPSQANRITPFSFDYLYGVTPYPVVGNGALLAEFATAGVNYVGTAAQGGLANAILVGGTTADAYPFNFWYSADWVLINGQQDLANEIIVGSNSKANPLYYDQAGINRLKARLVGTLNRGGAYGAILGPSTVEEIDFGTYVTANPGAYEAGTYNGLSATVTPLRGFSSITFNLTVDFTAQSVVSAVTAAA